MSETDEIVGTIDCEQKCSVPDGVRLFEVPRPRHAWTDVLNCPNCGRSFMQVPKEESNPL